MKRAIVTQRPHQFEPSGETRDTLDKRLTLFLMAAGFYSFPIPSIFSAIFDVNQWVEFVDPDLIVLSGGDTPGENLQRDIFEEHLLSIAEKREIPVFGICRGMQFLAYREGEKLQKLNLHVATKHKIHGKIEKVVNSYHNFGFNNAPKNYCITARAEDGTVEAMMHNSLPWLAIMWHPERSNEFDHGDISLLQNLKNTWV